ncbi:MAG: DUF2510 domain-containing protein [Patescibacteria group bacterium]|nr:DUF2510 domain-containing protein [Patescibacteria group bacterium]
MTDPEPPAAPTPPPAPTTPATWAPGWYAYPGTGQLRWWDGTRWASAQSGAQLAPPRNGTAVGAFVFGLLAGIFAWIPLFGVVLGGLLGICAIVAGIAGLAQGARFANRGNWYALLGILFAIGALVIVWVQIIIFGGGQS